MFGGGGGTSAEYGSQDEAAAAEGIPTAQEENAAYEATQQAEERTVWIWWLPLAQANSATK